MPRKPTAHAQLDQLRQQAAAERVRHRDLQAELEAAELEVEQASHAIAAGYAAEDQHAVTAARKAEEAAAVQVKDLQHRVTGAELRVEDAQRAADLFAQDHAYALLEEREQPARTVTAELTASVHQTLKRARAYLSERQIQDQLVAAVPGATPRADGPASTFPWESRLRELERAVQEHPEIDPPLPRWHGLQQRREQDNVHRRAGLLRRKKLTPPERDEPDRLNQDRVITPAVAMVNPPTAK